MEPNRREFQKQCAFQSFCKRVLHNEACNAHDEIRRRRKREVSFCDLALHEERQLYTVDKGLEWDTVVVATIPTKRDGTSLINMFNSPEILGENNFDEFVRIYYVACSRARKSLYIHIPDDQELKSTIKRQIDLYVQDKKCLLEYEFI